MSQFAMLCYSTMELCHLKFLSGYIKTSQGSLYLDVLTHIYANKVCSLPFSNKWYYSLDAELVLLKL